MTGMTQTLQELTLTAERKFGGTLLARVEYRRDFSDTSFFLERNGLSRKSQHTVTLGLVYGFATRI